MTQVPGRTAPDAAQVERTNGPLRGARLVRRGIRRQAQRACSGLLALGPMVAGVALLAACASEPPPVDDEPVRVRAYVESSDVVPARPFWLTVEVDKRADVKFELPDVGEQIRGLVILDDEVQPEQRVAGRVFSKRRLELKAPVSGTYLIPGVEAPWTVGDSQVGAAGSGPILVEAKLAGGAEAEQQLRPLKPPAKPDPDRSWLVLVGAIVALLAVAAGLLLRRRRATVEPPVPPHVRAAEQLAALRLRPVGTAEEQAAFAYALSGTLRRYLEERFGFAAWRMTTAEVLRNLPAELSRSGKLAPAIQQVLEASDEVKFAGRQLPEPTLRGWIEQASQVVQTTKPQEESS